MANQFKFQKIALATSAFLCLASVLTNGIAQSADSATLNISGQVTATTCNIVISDPGGTGATGTKVLSLGNVPGPGIGGINTFFGPKFGAIFSVSSTASNAQACTFQGGNTKWDLALALTASQIGSIGTNTFLKNSLSASAGGTDSFVVLKGGVGSTLDSATTVLSLAGDAGVASTLMSGGALPTASSTSSIAITAQFVRASGTTAPTSGAFSQTIPLLARYN